VHDMVGDIQSFKKIIVCIRCLLQTCRYEIPFYADNHGSESYHRVTAALPMMLMKQCLFSLQILSRNCSNHAISGKCLAHSEIVLHV
ncbi:hypothetical protein GUITHDRAFT_154291, partial [Guillardia theta CCMP2712]